MKSLIALILIIIVLLSFTGCTISLEADPTYISTQPDNTSEATHDNNETTTAEQEKPFDPHDPDQPELIAVQEALSTAIDKCKLPIKIDTTMVGMGSPNESEATFSFNLEYDDIVKTQYLEVTVYALNGIMQNGFEVYLNPNCDESVIKDIILCSMISIDPGLDYQQAEEQYLKMTDGYTGEGRSNVISLNGYNIHISESVLLRSGSGGYRGYPMLHIVDQNDLAPQYDIGECKAIAAVPDKRDLVFFTGTVEKAYDDRSSYILEVSSDNSIYGIYYMQDKFAGCFEVGKTYTFYGIFAGERDGFTSSILLDGFVE